MVKRAYEQDEHIYGEIPAEEKQRIIFEADARALEEGCLPSDPIFIIIAERRARAWWKSKSYDTTPRASLAHPMHATILETEEQFTRHNAPSALTAMSRELDSPEPASRSELKPSEESERGDTHQNSSGFNASAPTEPSPSTPSSPARLRHRVSMGFHNIRSRLKGRSSEEDTLAGASSSRPTKKHQRGFSSRWHI